MPFQRSPLIEKNNFGSYYERTTTDDVFIVVDVKLILVHLLGCIWDSILNLLDAFSIIVKPTLETPLNRQSYR